jgi:hypothetical protein
METVNIIMIVVGVIVALIGVVAFFNPSFARIINAPGGPRLKAIIALIAGIIILIVGLIVQIPR